MAEKSQQANEQTTDAADRAIDEHLASPVMSEPANDAAEAAPASARNALLDDLEQLQKKAAERDEFLKLLQHLRADYANYQKRVSKEMENTRRFACQPLILDLLAGMDNLERAMQAADSSDNSSGLLDGIRMVHQQLLGSLARHGVHTIEAVGKPFDPELHEALLEQPQPDRPERTVLQELEKGYTLHGRVIRPAKVVVSAATGQETPAATRCDTN